MNTQETLSELGKYPPETVEIVTEEYGYPKGTGAHELRDELASLRIDLGRIPRDWLAESASELMAVADLWEECEHLPKMYQAMIQRCEWYLEEVPIDVGAKEFGMTTIELLKLIEQDERE